MSDQSGRADLTGGSPSQQQQVSQQQQPTPRYFDRQWPGREPLTIQPSPERLDVPSMTVTITNHSDREPWLNGQPHPQTHIVLNRQQQGIEIRAGETKRDIEMLKCDVAHFVRLRGKGMVELGGRIYPQHPLEVHDVKLEDVEHAMKPETLRQLREAEAKRDRELAAQEQQVDPQPRRRQSRSDASQSTA